MNSPEPTTLSGLVLHDDIDAVIAIDVPRFQFPGHPGKYDGSWLIVRGQVWTGTSHWSFQDPCMLIEEAFELADWLDAVAAQPAPDPKEFKDWWATEPALRFHFCGSLGSHLKVRVYFGDVATAPGRHFRPRNHFATSWVSVSMTPDDLIAAAAKWRTHLEELKRANGK